MESTTIERCVAGSVFLVTGDAAQRHGWLRVWNEREPALRIVDVADLAALADADAAATTGDTEVTVVVDAGAAAESGTVVATLQTLFQGRPVRPVVVGASTPDAVRAALLSGARAYLFPARHPGPGPAGHAAAGNGDGSAGNGDGPTGPDAAIARIPRQRGPAAVDAEDGRPHLSRREIEVLRRVADGLTNQEISEHLDISTLTVKNHLSRISRRLEAADRAHAVLLALRAGLIG